MKKLFLSMLVMVCAFATASSAIKVGDLWFEPYTPEGQSPTASVVPPPSGEPSYQSTLSGQVVVPSEVTYVFTSNGQSTTYNCAVVNLMDAPFRNCTDITEVVLPNTLTTMGGNSFWGCTSLQAVNIPAGVTKIWGSIFRGCTALETIVVDTNNPVYDSRDNCNAIIETATNTLINGCKGSTIPATVTEIGTSAFMDITDLTSVTFPNSLTKINSYAFEKTGLTEITIPASVNTIVDNPFAACSNLATIVVDANNTVYDSRNNCNAIIETGSNKLISGSINAVIPDDVTQIGNKAFQSIKIQGQSVVVPEGVTSIGNSAFAGSDLKTLTLPSTLKALGVAAFSTNMHMEDVYCYAPGGAYEYMGTAVWQMTNDLPNHPVNLHVFAEDVEWYSGADQWSSFNVMGDLIHDAALYLYGVDGDWTEANAKAFTKDASGNWTLTQEMGTNVEFKLVDQDGGWHGGTNDSFLITKEIVTNATPVAIDQQSDGLNFKIPVAGTWTLTVDPTLQTLTVTGEWTDHLYLKGTFLNNWQGSAEFQQGEDGKWTITQVMQQGDEFKIVDDYDNWYGGQSGNNEITQDMVENGTTIDMISEDGCPNFVSPVFGEWTLTVDMEAHTLAVSGTWPEPEYTHVYILGEVDKYDWDPSDAPEMNTDDGIVYTYDANFDGRGESGENYFSFTTELGKNWEDIDDFRFGAVSEGDYWFDDTQLGNSILLTSKNGQSIRIMSGDYKLTLNLEEMTLVITRNTYLKGDVDGNGKVDVTDVNIVVNIILGKDSADNYDGRADVIADDAVDVSDVNAIVNIILGKDTE